jgi:hypothetical protein
MPRGAQTGVGVTFRPLDFDTTWLLADWRTAKFRYNDKTEQVRYLGHLNTPDKLHKFPSIILKILRHMEEVHLRRSLRSNQDLLVWRPRTSVRPFVCL